MDEERNPDCHGGHEDQYEGRRLANREVVVKGCMDRRERAAGSKTPGSRNRAVTDHVVLVAPHEQLAGRRERHSRNEWSVDRPIGRHREARAGERDITTRVKLAAMTDLSADLYFNNSSIRCIIKSYRLHEGLNTERAIGIKGNYFLAT